MSKPKCGCHVALDKPKLIMQVSPSRQVHVTRMSSSVTTVAVYLRITAVLALMAVGTAVMNTDAVGCPDNSYRVVQLPVTAMWHGSFLEPPLTPVPRSMHPPHRSVRTRHTANWPLSSHTFLEGMMHAKLQPQATGLPGRNHQELHRL